MTQRIFDVENEKDMADLWNILPDDVSNAKKSITFLKVTRFYNGAGTNVYNSEIFNINWHDKTEITRPIQEATNEDIGKICAFWDCNTEEIKYGKLETIVNQGKISYYHLEDGISYYHCRRLTKQEIEELC